MVNVLATCVVDRGFEHLSLKPDYITFVSAASPRSTHHELARVKRFAIIKKQGEKIWYLFIFYISPNIPVIVWLYLYTVGTLALNPWKEFWHPCVNAWVCTITRADPPRCNSRQNWIIAFHVTRHRTSTVTLKQTKNDFFLKFIN